MTSIFSNFAGAQNGKFFQIVPPHVDKKLPPGYSELPVPTFWAWVSGFPFVLLFSPNTIWAVIALAVYFVFPYDLSPTSTPFAREQLLTRFTLYCVLVFGYNGFFHTALYFLNWANRPFIKNRVYNVDKVIHNLFWSLSGVFIWTLFEATFIHLWSTGRLSYLSDKDAFSSPYGALNFFLSLWLIPIWRDFHFYFAHRLIHFKAMFQMVHSLHHRNTDIEPFSGLTMHPVEHLYYYSCILPSLVIYLSPFALMWNGIHLVLSPGASHSGYEDHWHAGKLNVC
jgi:sterol desaturase/sphingolipid hydroxylase (fatty acid hydroxylase superfamily)